MAELSRAAYLQPRLCEAQSGAKLLLTPSEQCVAIGQEVSVDVCIKNLCALSTANDAPFVPAVLKAGAKLEAALSCKTSQCTDLVKGVFEIDADDPFTPARGVEGLSWESGVCTLTQHAWSPQVRPVAQSTRTHARATRARLYNAGSLIKSVAPPENPQEKAETIASCGTITVGKDLNLPKANEHGKAGELCLGTVKAKALTVALFFLPTASNSLSLPCRLPLTLLTPDAPPACSTFACSSHSGRPPHRFPLCPGVGLSRGWRDVCCPDALVVHTPCAGMAIAACDMDCDSARPYLSGICGR